MCHAWIPTQVKRAMNEINKAKRLRAAAEEEGEAIKIRAVKEGEAEAARIEIQARPRGKTCRSSPCTYLARCTYACIRRLPSSCSPPMPPRTGEGRRRSQVLRRPGHCAAAGGDHGGAARVGQRLQVGGGGPRLQDGDGLDGRDAGAAILWRSYSTGYT
jgi:hypothetical protein